MRFSTLVVFVALLISAVSQAQHGGASSSSGGSAAGTGGMSNSSPSPSPSYSGSSASSSSSISSSHSSSSPSGSSSSSSSSGSSGSRSSVSSSSSSPSGSTGHSTSDGGRAARSGSEGSRPDRGSDRAIDLRGGATTRETAANSSTTSTGAAHPELRGIRPDQGAVKDRTIDRERVKSGGEGVESKREKKNIFAFWKHSPRDKRAEPKKQATTEKRTPPKRCKKGEICPVCGPGENIVHGKCVPAPVTASRCSPQELEFGSCNARARCEPGYSWDGIRCVPNNNGACAEASLLADELRVVQEQMRAACAPDPSARECISLRQQHDAMVSRYRSLYYEASISCRGMLPDPATL